MHQQLNGTAGGSVGLTASSNSVSGTLTLEDHVTINVQPSGTWALAAPITLLDNSQGTLTLAGSLKITSAGGNVSPGYRESGLSLWV